MPTLDEILAAVQALDSKVSRQFDALVTILEKGGALKDPPATPPPPVQEPLATNAKRVLTLDRKDGKFEYGPGEKWSYRHGTSVQWVSETGRFTVRIDPYSDFPSPYEGKKEIRSSNEPDETGRWRTPVVNVDQVLSESERLARRYSGGPPVELTYTVALEADGEIHTDNSRRGGPC